MSLLTATPFHQSLIQRGDGENREKLTVDKAVKKLNADMEAFKKQTLEEIESLREHNIALKESLQKSLATIVELLHNPPVQPTQYFNL